MNDNTKNVNPEDVNAETFAVEEGEQLTDDAQPVEGDVQAEAVAETLEDKLSSLQADLDKEKKEYMFLMAEFDNFRKRTLREKSELIKNAGEQVLKGLLPIVDDFERGLKASEGAEDPASIREGMELIYNKLVKYLAANGVKAMDTSDGVFDADRHDAIASVPVPEEDKKGKIIDTVEKGYTLNDKVLRHAKVVVGK
ncbi:MAG: nucleotide exchange factor GrpE [Bacteroides sp.]|nr:nucleotide exchange factor GrpE [Bacteroides sp.]